MDYFRLVYYYWPNERKEFPESDIASLRRMKQYLRIFWVFHRKNVGLYLSLGILVFGSHLLNLPTPLALLLGDRWYWSKGLTRAFFEIVHGNFYSAFMMNPLIYFFWIAMILFVFWEPIREEKKQKPSQ